MKRITKLSKDLYQLEGDGEEYAYLLLGGEMAALIDTTAGYGSVLAAVRSVTSLPLLVLNTHGHVDHAGGDYDFDEVWIHPEDIPLLRVETTAVRRMWFLNKVAASHGCEGHFDGELLKPPCPVRFLELSEGQIFDLGGVTLETFFVPGHTVGSVCFLDRLHGRLFGGDSFHDHVQLFFDYSAPVKEYRRSVEKMLCQPVESIYAGHGLIVLGRDCLKQLLDGCDRILHGERGVPLPDGTCVVWPQKENGDRRDGLHGNIYYKV